MDSSMYAVIGVFSTMPGATALIRWSGASSRANTRTAISRAALEAQYATDPRIGIRAASDDTATAEKGVSGHCSTCSEMTVMNPAQLTWNMSSARNVTFCSFTQASWLTPAEYTM